MKIKLRVQNEGSWSHKVNNGDGQLEGSNGWILCLLQEILDLLMDFFS